jgi:hypothetical protein
MHASADGYAAQLAMMQASAARVLQEMPPHFAAHFEKLSPGIQTKAFRALRQYRHLGIYHLIDKIQPTLTLSEMAEAQAWLLTLPRLVVNRQDFSCPCRCVGLGSTHVYEILARDCERTGGRRRSRHRYIVGSR